MMSRRLPFVDLLPISGDQLPRAFPGRTGTKRGGAALVSTPDAESADMQDRPDDFTDSFYYRAIRTRIGAALQAQYDLAKPLPDRISDLLAKLDQTDVARADGRASERQEPSRQESTWHEPARQEPARQESSGQGAERRDAERQETVRRMEGGEAGGAGVRKGDSGES
jgi:hypothetical protein